MKTTSFYLFFSISLTCGIFADQVIEEKRASFFGDEVSSLEQLIHVNEKRLLIQKDLKEKMIKFQKQKEEFHLGNQTKSHTFAMVSNARQILVSIKEEHLSYLFATDYLEELIFFSSIAAKSVPIKP